MRTPPFSVIGLFAVCVALMPGFSPAQEAPDQAPKPSLEQALEAAREDLEQSLEKLRAARRQVAAEKPALAAEFAKVRAELLAKRRQAELARMSQADRAASLADLQRKMALVKQDLSYTSGLVGDLPAQLVDRAPSVERAALEQALPGALPASAALEERLQRQGEVLEASFDRIGDLLGGRVIEGRAVTVSGEEVTGRAALFGPLAVFANGDVGGQIYDSTDLIPHLHGDGDFAAAKAITDGGGGTIKLDLTGGSAQALAELDSGPLDLVRKGGFWVYPILLMALVSALCAVIKFVGISSIRLPREHWVADILAKLEEGDQPGAIELAGETRHPAGSVFSKALEATGAGAEVVEELIYEAMIGVQSRLQRWLPFIAITAATAPLLGLLGTVSGMIRTFNVIQIFGSGDPKPLAGGISEALVTTLFGLVVAIPALILHAMLSRRCQGILQSTEQLGLTLVNGLRRREREDRS